MPDLTDLEKATATGLADRPRNTYAAPAFAGLWNGHDSFGRGVQIYVDVAGRAFTRFFARGCDGFKWSAWSVAPVLHVRDRVYLEHVGEWQWIEPGVLAGFSALHRVNVPARCGPRGLPAGAPATVEVI